MKFSALPLVTTLALATVACIEPPTLDRHERNLTPAEEQQRMLERISNTLESDIRFLSGMTMSGTLPEYRARYGAEFTGDNIMSWVGARMRAIHYIDHNVPDVRQNADGTTTIVEGSSSAVLAANISGQGPHRLGHFLIGPNFMSSTMPQIARISTLVHESRHSDGYEGGWTDSAGHPHSMCPQDESRFGNMAGGYHCDYNLDGSYGYEGVFLKQLLVNCSNCSQLVKRQAGAVCTS